VKQGKDSLFNEWCWETGHPQAEGESGTFVPSSKKLTHNGKHLSVNPGTIKLSENSTGENLRKPGLVKCET